MTENITEFSFRVPAGIAQSAEWRGMRTAAEILKNAGFQACLVGGAVRDLLLGLAPKDFDIATDARPDEIAGLFERSIPLGASFGVVTVLLEDFSYEVATFREERSYMDGRHPESVTYTKDPRLDAARRDFTVNALMFDPERSVILDYTGGLADLRKGILRTVGNAERRFAEDHLRMLRAVRFAARLGFEPDGETFIAIRAHAGDIATVSPERIRDELQKMLLHPSRERAFRMLSATGLLKVVLPEIEAMRGVTQPEKFHPEGDVFEHTMLMLTHIMWPTPEIVWSVLLHDVAKPVTRTVKDGIPHFYGHEAIGAEMAETIMKRLRHMNALTESVTAAVKNHMRYAHVDEMRASTWKRIAADRNFPVELELHRIDCISCHGFLQNYVRMLDKLRDLECEQRDAALPPPFLNGNDLIALGMKPGAAMGILLREIADLQLENQLKTRAEALEYARKKLRTEITSA